MADKAKSKKKPGGPREMVIESPAWVEFKKFAEVYWDMIDPDPQCIFNIKGGSADFLAGGFGKHNRLRSLKLLRDRSWYSWKPSTHAKQVRRYLTFEEAWPIWEKRFVLRETRHDNSLVGQKLLKQWKKKGSKR